jgi:hypothetical protein
MGQSEPDPDMRPDGRRPRYHNPPPVEPRPYERAIFAPDRLKWSAVWKWFLGSGVIFAGFALREAWRRQEWGTGDGLNVVRVLFFGAFGFLLGVAVAAAFLVVFRAAPFMDRRRARRADRWRR